uniref:GIY-YIG domain-containing protein n=1 Tax=viral metagenome TaxID=1070528 RepID=A0A6C0CER1_9ZZZZ
MAYGHIYKITNTINGKEYYGQTIQTPPIRRWYAHKNSAKHGRDCCKALNNSLRLHGTDNFKFEVICSCDSKEELNKKEIELISVNNSLVPNGYNILKGGSSSTLTDDIRKKMSDSRKGILHPWQKERMKGNTYKLGKKESDETKSKKSHAMKGNINKLGKKESDETKFKKSKAHMGKKQSPEHIANRLRSIKETLERRKNERSESNLHLEV